MKALLEELVKKSNHFVELRYHKRTANSFAVQKGRVDVANHSITAGVGVRALIDGVWGFSATADLSRAGIEKAIQLAIANGKTLSHFKGKGTVELARGELSREDFTGPGFDEIQNMSVADKLSQVVRYESELAKAAAKIQTAICRYKEIIEEKIIITSDGADCSFKIVQPEVSLAAIAEDHGAQVSSYKSAGVNGGWQCLYSHPSLENLVDSTAQLAVDLLKAKFPQGGQKQCILAPTVVGLLCHEAIGHTVEADFVKSGSIAKGKIGEMVASPLVNMCDSGCETIAGYAVGNLPFDDEGVVTETTRIIDKGQLVSYLHNRESAYEFKVKPTGNARAWLYDDEPLIRMRNTYMEPGDQDLSQMIAEMDDGYLIDGAGGGQADSNGEFMFGCGHVWKINKGKKTELLREATLSGIAFDVLKSVDAVSKEFQWDLGSGYCGKGQPAKVDAGGPYIRCKIHVGGRA